LLIKEAYFDNEYMGKYFEFPKKFNFLSKFFEVNFRDIFYSLVILVIFWAINGLCVLIDFLHSGMY